MIILSAALTALYFLGVMVLIFSESVCIELFRYFIADLSFETIEKISGDPCGQPFFLYVIRKVAEKTLMVLNLIVIACTLGFLVWVWMGIWSAIVNPILTLRARWDECKRQKEDKT